MPSLLDVIAVLDDEVTPQLHLATHSPMVMASAEPRFDVTIDALHHLRLEDQYVVLESHEFVKRGPADVWLMSEIFGLSQPRSLPSEIAIENAKQLQMAPRVDPMKVQEVHKDLCRLLAPDDEFWPRWLFFAEENGVDV